MENLSPHFSTNFLEALGFMLLHSLWQATAIALIAYCLLAFLQHKKPSLRYWIANVTLWCVLFSAITTFFFYFETSAVNVPLAPNFVEIYKPATPIYIDKEIAPVSLSEILQGYLPIVAVIWLMGALFLLLKLSFNFWLVQRLRTSNTSSVGIFWQEKLAELSKQFNITRSVVVAQSRLIQTPLTLGFFKPIILLPFGIINQLSLDQVEVILLHELAHIRRHDYLLNLVQSFIEALFYFHPAVWWLSKQVRTEREFCCDDEAIAISGNALLYAKTLLSIQSGSKHTPLAMAFLKKEYPLLARIQRILNVSNHKNQHNIMERILVTSTLVAMLLFTYVNAQGVAQNEHLAFNKNEMVADTLPPKKIVKKEVSIMKRQTDKENFELEMENGEIKKLLVDGKLIEKSDYAKYKHLVDELKSHQEGVIHKEEVATKIGENGTKHIQEIIIRTEGEGKENSTQKTVTVVMGDGSGSATFPQKQVSVEVEADTIIIMEVPMQNERTKQDIEMAEKRRAEQQKEYERLGKKLVIIRDSTMLKWDGKPQKLRGFTLNDDGKFKWQLGDSLHREELKRLYDNNLKFMPAPFPKGMGLTQAIEMNLVEDGLIKVGSKYTFRLEEKRMSLNGKKQPVEVLNKYKDIYKEFSGFDMGEGIMMEIKKTAEAIAPNLPKIRVLKSKSI